MKLLLEEHLMSQFWSRSLAALAITGSTLGVSSYAHAESYPNRPVTIIVPFSAGGGVDPWREFWPKNCATP